MPGSDEWGKYAREADLNSLRDYSMKELEDLRKALKEKNEDHTKNREEMIMLEDQIRSMKNLLEETNREMKEMQNIAANRANEQMKEFDDKMKEKDAELDSLRKAHDSLRKAHEEKDRKYCEELNKINYKMMQQDDLIASMNKLLEEKNNEIIEANRQDKLKMAPAIAIIRNIVAKNDIEKDAINLNTKIDSMRHVVSIMEDDREHSVHWLENENKKELVKKSIPFLTRADKAKVPQTHLESMTEQFPVLKYLMNEAITLASNPAFDRDLAEKAKEALTYGLRSVAHLYNEIARLKVVMAGSPRTASLDGIMGCLNNIMLAINSVPSMLTQSTNKYIDEEMKKLEIKDQ